MNCTAHQPNTLKLFGLPIFLLMLAASGNAYSEPQIAKENDVKSCEYLADVEGGSGYGKNYNWQNLAKYAALKKAEKMAATHVVWVQFNPVGGFNGVAVAKTYRCQLAQKSDR